MMDTDDKPPESGDEIEPVSLREIEMILKPGKPPPPIKKPDAPSPPRPPRAPLKTAARTQADMGVGDLAAFAVLSGSTPPPPAVAAKPPGRAPMSSSTDEAGRPRPPRPLPKPPTAPKRESLVDERERGKREEKAPDSALEDLRALARESTRPKSASVDFDDLLSMRDDASARALSSPAIPMDLTLLTSGPLGTETSAPASTPDEGWDDPLAPAKAKGSAVSDDPEPPPSAPPSSARGPSSRRAIGRESSREGKSSRPPKSQRGARTASKAPPPKKPAEDRSEPGAPIVAAKARSASVTPAARDSTSVAPQSMPPAFAKRRSTLPILLGAGALALVAIIWFASRGSNEPAPEAKNSAAAVEATTPLTRPREVEPRPSSTEASAPPRPDAVATRSGNPEPVSPGPNSTGTRPVDPVDPVDPVGTTPTTPTTSTSTTPTAKPTTTPTATPTTEPGGEFNAGAASAALAGRAGAAAGCKQPGDPSGVATVTVTFAPSGRVTQANVSGPPFAGTKTGGCIAGAMKGASVPPFSGPAKTVSKTVQIP